MSKFAKFLAHYAGEAVKVAEALGSIASGIALPNVERDKVNDTIGALTDAATNILAGIDKITDPVIKIEKKDIEAAVAAALPKILSAEVTKAVTAALATEAAKDATDKKAGNA